MKSSILLMMLLLFASTVAAEKSLPSRESVDFQFNTPAFSLRGSEEVDLANVFAVTIDCSQPLPTVKNAQHVIHLRITNYYGWIPRLGEILASMSDLKYCLVRGSVDRLADEWKVLVGCSRLEYLRLELEGLRNLPPWLSEFGALRGLDVSRNKFDVIPSEVMSLTSLEELDFSENILRIIDHDFSALSKLRRLNLAFNNLISLQGAIAPANLTKIQLNDNKLTSFPATFLDGKLLETVSLESNYFSLIPPEWLARTPAQKITISRFLVCEKIHDPRIMQFDEAKTPQ